MNTNYEQIAKHLMTNMNKPQASGNKEEADKLSEQGYRLDYVSIGEGCTYTDIEQLKPEYAPFGGILYAAKEERNPNSLASKIGILKNVNRFFVLWKES